MGLYCVSAKCVYAPPERAMGVGFRLGLVKGLVRFRAKDLGCYQNWHDGARLQQVELWIYPVQRFSVVSVHPPGKGVGGNESKNF